MSAKPVIDINVDAAKLSSVTKIKEATTLCSDGDPKQANRRFQAVHNIVQDFVKRHAEDCATTPRQWNKPFWQQLTSTLLKESSFIRESFSSTRPGFDTRKHFSWPEDKIKIGFLLFCLLKLESSKFFAATKRKNGNADEATRKKAKFDNDFDDTSSRHDEISIGEGSIEGDRSVPPRQDSPLEESDDNGENVEREKDEVEDMFGSPSDTNQRGTIEPTSSRKHDNVTPSNKQQHQSSASKGASWSFSMADNEELHPQQKRHTGPYVKGMLGPQKTRETLRELEKKKSHEQGGTKPSNSDLVNQDVVDPSAEINTDEGDHEQMLSHPLSAGRVGSRNWTNKGPQDQLSETPAKASLQEPTSVMFKAAIKWLSAKPSTKTLKSPEKEAVHSEGANEFASLLNETIDMDKLNSSTQMENGADETRQSTSPDAGADANDHNNSNTHGGIASMVRTVETPNGMLDIVQHQHLRHIAGQITDTFAAFYGKLVLCIDDAEVRRHLLAAKRCRIQIPGKQAIEFIHSDANTEQTWKHRMWQATQSVAEGKPYEGEDILVEFE